MAWNPYDETKSDAWRRLKREGRWEAFQKRKVEIKGKRGGKDDDAFREALTEFPPLKKGEKWEPPSDSDAPESVEDEPESDSGDETDIERDYESESLVKGAGEFGEDFAWAWENVGNESVGPADSPTWGSGYLLQYARDHRAKFVEFAMKHFSSKKDVDEEKAMSDDRRKQMALLDQFADLVRHCPSCGATFL